MRSAFLCVFFALIVHREGSRATTDEDFKPTPIPLNDWHSEKKDEPAVQEVTSDATPVTAAIPAHYWEDALRHSVYLTLVRDKIDQLIAKGNVISPNGKLEHASKEVDDHNLWEQIKTAPFDRLQIEEPDILGDITIMSKGRLLEEKSGYRFIEDETSREKCDARCMEDVKAFWSVKRVRQRDSETLGKYNHELTFSVNSQPPRKHKKPYDNPVRTFTVREGTPVDLPQYTQTPVSYAPRPQRAVWFHKNIVPAQNYQSRKNYQPKSLDRLFLSLFSSEEDQDDEPPRYRPNPYVQQGYPQHGHPHYSKAGYVGAQSEQHQNKKLTYSYKPTPYKYLRPLGPPPSVSQAEHHYHDSDKSIIPFAPPQVPHYPMDSEENTKIPFAPPHVPHHPVDSDGKTKTKLSPPQVPHFHIDAGVKIKNQYPEQYHYDVKTKAPYPPSQSHHHYIEPDEKQNPYVPADHRYQPSDMIKTTKQAVLPTPTFPLNITMEVTNQVNASEMTTKEPEQVTAFKPYPKYKPPPTKISYFPEHVRPPVFNAPPGVFATMDKKPFKPLPPLKYHQHHQHSKPVKTRPADFRPSPQVLDVQFSDPDPLSDAFRPMPMHYADNNSSETSEKPVSGKHKTIPHKNVIKSKPTKKHELIKSQRTTTSTPEIITAQSLQSIEEESMNWANSILGAFAKTKPMVSQKVNITESTTPFEENTTITDATTTVTLATTMEVKLPEETTTVTPKPPKRTRPPPKFTKPNKLKKHKRITSTSTTTTTTTTTENPRFKKPLPDLHPQASSATTGTTKPSWQPKSQIQNITTTTPIAIRATNATTTSTNTFRPLTTTKPTTTTTKLTTTSIAPETEPPVATTQPKNKNRFRQSTLMHKGTSVNHDKWSMSINKTVQSNGNNNQRRKGSNFQGYVSSTPKNVEDQHKEEHVDLAYNSNAEISTTPLLLEVIPVIPEPSPASEIQVEEQSDYPNGTQETDQDETEDSDESTESDEEQESKDQSEFIFGPTETNENSNEVIVPNLDVKEESVVGTTHATMQNKTKCKKKKHNNTTTVETPSMAVDSKNDNFDFTDKVMTTTTEKATIDLIAEIFGGYTVEGLSHNDSKKVEPLGEGSDNQERFAPIDDDLEDFLHSLEEKKHDNENEHYDEDENDEDNDDYSPFNNEEEESRSPRHSDVNYEDYRDRPYSFLELMAME